MATKSSPKTSEYPELWYMFDAVNTLVAGFHEYGDKDDDEEDYGFVLQIETDRVLDDLLILPTT